MAKSFPNTGVTTGLASDRTAMTGMFAGQEFFETDTKKLWLYNGSAWVESANYSLTTRPAFYAWRTSGNPGAPVTITYNTAQINIGSHLNLSTGLFTAPITGLYWFMFSAFKETTVSSAVQINWVINGAITSMRGYTDVGGYSAASPLGGPLVLNANDTIGVSLQSGVLHGTNNCFFAGFLIS